MSGASNELSTNGMTWKDELRRLFAQTQVEMWKYFLLEKKSIVNEAQFDKICFRLSTLFKR